MKKPILALAVILLLSRTSGTQQAPSVTPESGFISSEKYTNAFFGFSLPLPPDSAFQGLIVPPTADNAYHPLFGLKATKNRPAALTISARQQISASSEDAREAASKPKSQSVKRTAIGGKEFWKGESQEKSRVGKLRQIAYVTALNGYILEFRISSFDAKLADDLEHRVEAVSFFDPAQAQEAAGPSSRVYNPLALRSDNPDVTPSSSRIGQLDTGTISANIYKNDALGFTYEFPADWVVNEKAVEDKVIEAGHQFAWGNSPSAEREHEAFQRCGRVLLMAKEFPDEVKTEEVKPLIIILAMDSACSPATHFPKSLHDTEGIKETAQQLVRSFAGTPFISTGSYPVKAFMVQGHVILDISTAFQVSSPGRNALLDVFTSIDATELKGYLVGWGFRSGSQSGLEELKTTGKIAFDSR
jgi:hypothetical protein